MNILIVEPDEDARKSIARAVRQFRWKAVFAGTVEDAYLIFKQNKFDGAVISTGTGSADMCQALIRNIRALTAGFPAVLVDKLAMRSCAIEALAALRTEIKGLVEVAA